METIQNIGWSVVFSVVGGVLGMILGAGRLPDSAAVDRSRRTPNIDEQKEIARGNERRGRILWKTGQRRHPGNEPGRSGRGVGRRHRGPPLSQPFFRGMGK